MDQTGHRRAPAVGDIGHGACNCSRHRDSAEERHRDVGYSLADKFGVRASPVAGYAVGHGGGKQRFDGAEHCDGESRGKEQPDRSHVEAYGMRRRKR